MSAITVGGDLVHYEVLGRGRPVILLHGWLGSWRYWVPTMQQLHLKYRVYALDLFGFGDSGKNPDKYTVAQQVQLLDEFMKQLGITKAAFIGHGLGALVLSEFAIGNQDKVARILISSAPLFDPGDLADRTPAGQRKLLTAEKDGPATDPTPPTGEAKADAKPPKNEADPVEASKPAAVSEATLLRKPESDSHNLPTVPRVADSARVRIEEALARAATNNPTPSSVRPPEPNTKPEIVVTPSETIGDQPEKKPEPPGEMKSSNQNPLLESLANARLDALLAKCFKSSEPEYDKLKVDVDKTDDAVLKRSVSQFDSGRMLDMLRLLPMPVVIVHGSDDPVIPQPGEDVWQYLTVDKEDIMMPIPLPGVRHFPMLEHEPFLRLVNQFLEIADISKLEVKERWVRRTR